MVLCSKEQVLAYRATRHGLHKTGEPQDLESAARQAAGLQAQVPSQAGLALRARVPGLTPDHVDKALYQDRTLTRVWCMRGTAHIIPTRDIKIFIGALRDDSSTRELRWLRAYGLEPMEAQCMVDLITHALEEGPLTRRELAERLKGVLPAERLLMITSSWGGILRYASLTGLICFGPPRAGETTLALMDRWAGPYRQCDDQGKELLRIYLRANGPASARDYSYWSGMSMARAKQAFMKLEDEMAEVAVCGIGQGCMLRDGLQNLLAQEPLADSVCMLGSFDTYLLAHHNKGHLFPPHRYKEVFRKAGWVSSVVLANGEVRGIWACSVRDAGLDISICLFSPLSPKEALALEEEAHDLGRYMGADYISIRFTQEDSV